MTETKHYVYLSGLFHLKLERLPFEERKHFILISISLSGEGIYYTLCNVKALLCNYLSPVRPRVVVRGEVVTRRVVPGARRSARRQQGGAVAAPGARRGHPTRVVVVGQVCKKQNCRFRHIN